MPYQISYHTDSNIIEVQLSGDVAFTDRKSALTEICEQFAELPKIRLLVDVRNINNVMTEEEQIEFGELLASTKFLRGAKAAVLHPKEHNPNLLIDAVAYNKGYRLAEFTSRFDALNWLQGLIN